MSNISTPGRILLALAALLPTLPAQDTERQVVRAYAAYAHATYAECHARASALENAVLGFLDAPTDETLEAARTAWKHGREAYGTTEVLRFYSGPIDNRRDGPETYLNAWPVDESYIDGVVGAPNSGIINDPRTYPTLSGTLLTFANEKGGEANVCIGWHAIEFMLWGQDLNPKGPGQRDVADFIEGRAPNADRRREYLKAIAGLLVQHLAQLRDAWAPDRDNYRKEFLALPKRDAVRRILQGAVILSGFEMAGERLAVAYETQDQEDEHSCFSDNTHRDFITNQQGILHVWRGDGRGMKGIGLRKLAHEVAPEAAAELDRLMELSETAIAAIPAPFDRSVVGKDDSKGRRAILAAIEALEPQAEALAALGLELGFELPLTPGGR